jgi:D-alanine---D-serine ligase
MMHKLNIAVLFGGCSSEYSVSLQSAQSVISHMDREHYTPILIGISPEGSWFHFHGDLEKLAADTWCNPADCAPTIISPDRNSHKLLVFKADRIEEIPIDAAFPVLHGKNGEDGTVQGFFELMGIPLVGCGTLSSALCMDKDRAHKLAHAAGVSVPASFLLEKNTDWEQAFAEADRFGYPLFVKPVKAGSSYGVSKVLSRIALTAAIDLAFQYDDQVIIEESIPGFEVGCAVIGNSDLIVGEVDEIELSSGFFNYTEKYNLITSSIHVPARISSEKSEELKETAKIIYKALGCRGFARVDLFLTPSGKIVFNEVNTIPGFTSHSRFPTMMKAIGMPIEEMISNVIELAVSK